MGIAGFYYFAASPSIPLLAQKEVGPIEGDMFLQPGTKKDVKLHIDFGDGKSYEAPQDVRPQISNPLELLESNAEGIKREMNFASSSINLIKIGENNNLLAIGNYSADNSHQWKCYINNKGANNCSEQVIQDNDLVEWRYEEK